MRHFIASLPIAPLNLAERLETVVGADERQDIEAFEALVQEILELLQRHMPEANIFGAALSAGRATAAVARGRLAE